MNLSHGTVSMGNRRRGGGGDGSHPLSLRLNHSLMPRLHATASCRLRPGQRNNTAVQKNEHERKQRFMPENGTFSGRGSGRARRLLFSFQRIPNLRRELLVPLLQRLLLLLKRLDPQFERLDALV